MNENYNNVNYNNQNINYQNNINYNAQVNNGVQGPVNNQEQNKKKKHSPILLIILFIIIIIFGVWAFFVYHDYGRVKASKEPDYCWLGKSHTEYKKSDSYNGYEGTIDICKGPGYKVIVYKTVAFKVTEFVPMWEKTKTLEEVDKATK